MFYYLTIPYKIISDLLYQLNKHDILAFTSQNLSKPSFIKKICRPTQFNFSTEKSNELHLRATDVEREGRRRKRRKKIRIFEGIKMDLGFSTQGSLSHSAYHYTKIKFVKQIIMLQQKDV